jgi:hypothetical protein
MKISSIMFITALCNQSAFAWGLRGSIKARSSSASDMVVIKVEESEGETAAMMEGTNTINDAIVGGQLDQDRELPVVVVPPPVGIFGPKPSVSSKPSGAGETTSTSVVRGPI